MTRRVIIYAVTFFVVLNLTFILPRLVPGNAADVLAVGNGHSSNYDVALIEARLGLNQPLAGQYITYLKNIFTTFPPYLGVSDLYFPNQVSYLVATRMGWTLLLLLTSFALSMLMIYVVATISALRRGGKFEATSIGLAIIFNSTPVFWTAMIMLWVFAVSLKWFPLFGATGFTTAGPLDYLASVAWHAVLPVLVLTFLLFGEGYLLLRGSIQSVLQSDYVAAAKARGLKDRVLAAKYILRNSMLPIVSVFSFAFARQIGVVVLVEVVFGYPGMGDLIVDAVGARDYPVLQGGLFYVTILVIISGLIGDYVLTRLDPRLRH